MTFEQPDVEIAALRAQLANAKHIMKHVAEGIAAARRSLRAFHDRVPELLRLDVTSEDLDTYFGAVDTHHANIARTCATEECACESEYLDTTDPRPRGKVISLGTRVKSPRVYVQRSGEQLHPDPDGAA